MARFREWLRNPTDWGELFWRIQLTPLANDPRFSYQLFALQPLSLVKSALNAINRWEKRQSNTYAIATAKLGSLVAHSIASEDANPPNEDQFLPFPLEEETTSSNKTINADTAATLQRLIESGRLPRKAFAAFRRDL